MGSYRNALHQYERALESIEDQCCWSFPHSLYGKVFRQLCRCNWTCYRNSRRWQNGKSLRIPPWTYIWKRFFRTFWSKCLGKSSIWGRKNARTTLLASSIRSDKIICPTLRWVWVLRGWKLQSQEWNSSSSESECKLQYHCYDCPELSCCKDRAIRRRSTSIGMYCRCCDRATESRHHRVGWGTCESRICSS